ncbi:efflux RND transporter periplasmic adaptor subunit [Microvirga terrae]|uniref:Efflux RND transporter periplasmic adaptor subunit n=1 Tax=Microvirga terrae TaxID=2740529 RepID=A0ABY5RQH2_9HYPH|nr:MULTISPECIES: efflux RND transporter periplasmic adaptor subunit [Microvirga]MBQ0819555.1 efflux RND transporter periplasmic adaptor subunit [Microvirga sp. HBU67558]UVF19037.1 efflux RND transporter periplasmic adaptor subunit [Microvirga terrae]
MRVSGQLAVIAVLGAAGFGGWYAYQGGHLANVPVIGAYVSQPAGQQAAQGGRGRGGPTGPATVDVDTVKTGRIVEMRESVGTVRAFESITVTAKVAGIVNEIGFEEGQKVKAGDMLVQFDAAERRAEIEQAIAEASRAEALRNEVAIKLERAQALNRTGAGTGAQVDDLTAQMKSLEGSIASARAQRKAAEARLEDLIIRAPFAGRVGTRSVSLGAYVAPGTRITSLDDLSKVRLDFAVPENLLGRLKPGQTVNAISAAYKGRTFKGSVSTIDPRVDQTTRTARLTAEFENSDEALKPGMFLSVALEVSTKDDAVVVPEEAVVSEGLRHIVYPVKDNKVERRVITIGQRQGGKVEVVDGLKAGETIVVLGVQRVRPGAEVVARPVGSGAPAAPVPAANREQPSRSSLNVPQAIGAAQAAERK